MLLRINLYPFDKLTVQIPSFLTIHFVIKLSKILKNDPNVIYRANPLLRILVLFPDMFQGIFQPLYPVVYPIKLFLNAFIIYIIIFR